MNRKNSHGGRSGGAPARIPAPPGLDVVLRISKRIGLVDDLAEAFGDPGLACSVIGLASVILSDSDAIGDDDPPAQVRDRISQMFGKKGLRTEAILKRLAKLDGAAEKFGALRTARLAGKFDAYRAYTAVFDDDFELNPDGGFNIGVVLEDGFPKDCVFAAPNEAGAALKASDPVLTAPAAAAAAERWLVGGLHFADPESSRSLPLLVEGEAAGFSAIRRMMLSDPKSSFSRFLHGHFDECLLPRSYLPDPGVFVTRVPGQPEHPEEGRARYVLVEFPAYLAAIKDQLETGESADPDKFDAVVRDNASVCLASTKDIPTAEAAALYGDYIEITESVEDFWDALFLLMPDEYFERLSPEETAAIPSAVALIFQVALSILFETSHLLRKFERAMEIASPGFGPDDELEPYLAGTLEAARDLLSRISSCIWVPNPTGGDARAFTSWDSTASDLFGHISLMEKLHGQGLSAEQIARDYVKD